MKPYAALLLLPLINACSDDSSSNAGSAFNGGNSDNGNTDITNDFTRSSLLTDVTDQVLVPSIDTFHQLTESQTAAITAMCEGVVNNATDEAALSEAAQQSWRDAMNQWQQIEVMQIGPLLENDANLRNKIYSWPLVQSCAVDQDVGHFEAGSISGTPYDISKRTSPRRGLDALEYLLFNQNLAHSCSADRLAPEGWNERSEQERRVARCQFAVEVAKDLENNSQELIDAWQGESGYAQTLKTADSSVFDDEQAAINRITDAMFYVDSITKDSKLAAPIGLSSNSCGNASCVDDIESKLSANSINNIKNNLIGLQQLFIAADEANSGFDDFLTAVEAEELATTMKQDIQAAIDAADSFTGTLEEAVTNDPEKVQALHQAVKTVTDNLKSVFITYLALELPQTSAGDAD